MDDYKLFDAEYKFMCILWDEEPVNSTVLSRLCLEQLGWKKSTTYTMLRKLCERNMLQNENACVTALVKREQVQKYESEALMEKSFGGSIPAFVATLLHDKKLTRTQAQELQRLIEEAVE